MALDLSAVNETLKLAYLPIIREQLEKGMVSMNRFDLFTWRGEPVICPNCDPDHHMAYDPFHNALLCTRCSLQIPLRAIAASGEKKLTIEVLDRILQNEAHKREGRR